MLDTISRTAAILQNYALGQEPPEAVISAFAQLTGTERGMMTAYTGTVDGSRPFATLNMSANAITDYIRGYAAVDVQLQAIDAKYGTAPPPVILGDEVLPYEDFKHSELFDGFYRPLDVHRVMRITTGSLSFPGVAYLGVVLFRGKHHGAFGPEEKRVLAALAPQFHSAALTMMARRTRADASLASAFEHAADAMAILDSHGRLRYGNSTFDALRRALDEAYSLHWDTPLAAPAFAAVQAIFTAALFDLRHLGLTARSGEFNIAIGGATRRYSVAIMSVLTSAGVRSRRGEALFLLILRESDVLLRERIAALRKQYSLTAAQTRVLHELAQGADLREIAAKLRVSIHTARLHTKALLAKTGCRRQADLVRMIDSALTGQMRIVV